MPIPTLNELELLHNKLCRAVGDPRRIQIMYALFERSSYVTALAEHLQMPQPTVSRHLSVLRQAGLVNTERDGTSVVYSLADARIIEVLDTMRSMLRAALERETVTLE